MTHRCDSCNMFFKSKVNLERHKTTDRHKKQVSGNTISYKCVCGKFYAHPPSYYRHKRICNNNNTNASSIEEPVSVQTSQNEYNPNVIIHMQNQIECLNNSFAELNKKFVLLQSGVIEKSNKSIQTTDNLFMPRLRNRYKIPPCIRNQIRENQNNTCGICKKTITNVFQVDHITAIQFGGTNDIENLMALCCDCHAHKSIQENKHRKDIRIAIQNIIGILP